MVAPYDVRQGGFSGGGINAITKSGANEFFGTAYWFSAQPEPRGRRPRTAGRSATFSDKQFGASVGGPIVKDKAFFFVNVDLQRRKTCRTATRSAAASGQDFGHEAEVQRFLSILQSKYGYDPGGLRPGVHPEHRERQGLRAAGLQPLSQAPAHGAHTTTSTASNDLYGTTNSSTAFNYPDHVYQFNSNDQLHGGPAQQHLRHARSTSCALTYQRIRETARARHRLPPGPGRPAPTARGCVAGTEQFSTANALDQDIFELTDDFTLHPRQPQHHHRHPQRVLQVPEPVHPRQLRHLPLHAASTNFAGRASRSSTTTASRRRATRSRPREFSVNQFGFYAGDVWRVTPQRHPDLRRAPRHARSSRTSRPPTRPRSATFGYATDVAPNPTMFSPRVGLQLGRQGRRQAAAPRRRRHLLGPHAVRVALEPVRQHRHRVHAHRRELQRRATRSRSWPTPTTSPRR